MQRYNMFHQVHKGLRAMLYETALCLQHTEFDDAVQAHESLAQLQEVIYLFNKHAHSEDTYVFPAVEKFEPAVADAFEQEHVKDHQLGELLDQAIAAYATAAGATDRMEAGHRIQQAFTAFMVFNLEHMGKEESVINPILHRYYQVQELHAITQQIVSAIVPADMARFSRWMIRGLHNAEISQWLKEVELHAPEPVFQQLFQSVEKELPPVRFRQVIEKMTDGAMMA
ncbi:MAG: hemerythrin domain-containing protein [Chitinophagaceae bacterium]